MITRRQRAHEGRVRLVMPGGEVVLRLQIILDGLHAQAGGRRLSTWRAVVENKLSVCERLFVPVCMCAPHTTRPLTLREGAVAHM